MTGTDYLRKMTLRTATERYATSLRDQIAARTSLAHRYANRGMTAESIALFVSADQIRAELRSL
jgi:hypothetical protein